MTISQPKTSFCTIFVKDKQVSASWLYGKQICDVTTIAWFLGRFSQFIRMKSLNQEDIFSFNYLYLTNTNCVTEWCGQLLSNIKTSMMVLFSLVLSREQMWNYIWIFFSVLCCHLMFLQVILLYYFILLYKATYLWVYYIKKKSGGNWPYQYAG